MAEPATVREAGLNLRIGQGFDVHAFAEGRRLIIGGVEIPWHMGLAGHSDADVLAHAVCDALLGAAGMGDIGQHFPDTDAQFRNADSMDLLARVARMLRDADFAVVNVDGTVATQAPKLGAFRIRMESNLAAAMDIEASRVNIKATTTEKLGFVGREEGVAAMAIALLTRRAPSGA